jgi:hypothetical protein
MAVGHRVARRKGGPRLTGAAERRNVRYYPVDSERPTRAQPRQKLRVIDARL